MPTTSTAMSMINIRILPLINSSSIQDIPSAEIVGITPPS
jgi:hypothetical protein